ncbi:MAG TPA: DUF72 domain-containing protein [Azospirillaceae bacterium]|nr:DUF72 domain-containing protein [Azospirillaceae bacterium]
MAGRAYIGISGWTYRPWRGVFYPPGLRQKDELAYAAGRFTSIEINGTFYGLPRPDSFARWAADTPEGFVFAVKGSRYITHMKKLVDVEAPLANVLASGPLRLGDRLGPMLWQLPERLRFDPDRIARFLDLLPRDTEEAADLARRHEPRMEGRAWTETDARRPLRHALEIRHQSFLDPRFIELLRERNVSLVTADTPDWPLTLEVTADFHYVRLHGTPVLYWSGYEDEALNLWADRVRQWMARGDVYVYFDNDAQVRAPFDALGLMERLGEAGRAASAA